MPVTPNVLNAELPAVPEEATFYTVGIVDSNSEINSGVWKYVPEALRTIVWKDDAPDTPPPPPPGTVGVPWPSKLTLPEKEIRHPTFKSVAHSVIFTQRLKRMVEETERDRVAAVSHALDKRQPKIDVCLPRQHRFRAVVHTIIWANRLSRLCDRTHDVSSQSACSTSSSVSTSSEGSSKPLARKLRVFRSKRSKVDKSLAIEFSSMKPH